jgi:thymidylate synthase
MTLSAIQISSAPESKIPPCTGNLAKSPNMNQHEEYQYLDFIRDILENGEHRPDGTGTGTYSIFALLHAILPVTTIF